MEVLLMFVTGGNFKGVDSTVFLTIEMTRKDPKHIEFGVSIFYKN